MPPMSFTGIVTKVGAMQKTSTVSVSRWVVHAKTHKRLERSKKYLVHDENQQMRINDTVVIRNCPPISARKRFTLEKILKSPETEHDELLARLAAGGLQPGMLGSVRVLWQRLRRHGHHRSRRRGLRC